jgi:hypothetical protein
MADHSRGVGYRLHKPGCLFKADSFRIEPRRCDRAPHGRLIEPGCVSNTAKYSSHCTVSLDLDQTSGLAFAGIG